MRKRALLLIGLWIVFSGFQFSPETWIKDISNLLKRTKPKYDQITFWDFEQEKSRGIRAFVYTLAKEWENRQVDGRLYAQLSQFLAYMCQEVITIHSFEDKTKQQMVENVILDVADQWKLRGSIDPKALFDALPSIDFDVLVLMERSKYDQEWKGNEKRLNIGVNVAAFEMDYGLPLYNERVMVDLPWSGEDASFRNAEHAALLKVADAVGEALYQTAALINKTHDDEVAAALQAELKEKKDFTTNIVAENKALKELIKGLENLFKQRQEPQQLIQELKQDMAAIDPLLKKWPPSMTPEEMDQRQKLAASIQNKASQLDSFLAQEEARKQQESEAAKPALGVTTDEAANTSHPQNNLVQDKTLQPQTQSTGLTGSGVLTDLAPPSGNPFDRRWLLPEKSPSHDLPLLPDSGTIQPETIDQPQTRQGNTTQPQTISPELLKFQQAGGRIPPPPQIPQDFIGKYHNIFKAGKMIPSSTEVQPNTAAGPNISNPT